MMKRCAICAHDNKPSAYSCTACGEATWVPAPPPGDADAPTARMPAVRPDRTREGTARRGPRSPS